MKKSQHLSRIPPSKPDCIDREQSPFLAETDWADLLQAMSGLPDLLQEFCLLLAKPLQQKSPACWG
jgi:hypothetical protein